MDTKPVFYGSVGVANFGERININGQTLLFSGSGSTDVCRVLASLRGAVLQIDEISSADKASVAASLSAADEELKKAEPEGAKIKQYLSGAEDVLKGAAGAASGAIALATTLSEVGKWVAGYIR